MTVRSKVIEFERFDLFRVLEAFGGLYEAFFIFTGLLFTLVPYPAWEY